MNRKQHVSDPLAIAQRALLPFYLKPTGTFELVRLGGPNDGGYLVDQRDVDETTLLVALGINDDWSFERDFLADHPVPLLAYDGSVSPKVFARRMVQSLAVGGRGIRKPARALLTYGRFFRGPRAHRRSMIGPAGQLWVTSLAEVLEKNTCPSDRVFLKMDIEGCEYRVLGEIASYKSRIVGLVIEFHDVDLHRSLIEDFIKKIPLQLAHVHCNNHGNVSADGTPLVVELSFSSHAPKAIFESGIPHSLDAPNNPRRPDFDVEFIA